MKKQEEHKKYMKLIIQLIARHKSRTSEVYYILLGFLEG